MAVSVPVRYIQVSKHPCVGYVHRIIVVMEMLMRMAGSWDCPSVQAVEESR